MNRYRIEARKHGRWSWKHLGGREDDNTRNTRAEAQRVIETLIAAGYQRSELRVAAVTRDIAKTYQKTQGDR